MASSVVPAEMIQSANWSGSIPVILTLSSTSLSSPTVPPPIHVQLPRQTYLHTGLQAAVQRLYQFAPTTLSFASGMIRNEPEPESSEDDDATTATTDTTKIPTPAESKDASASAPSSREITTTTTSKATLAYPTCWFEDEDSQLPLRWHMSAGVLFDLKRTDRTTNTSSMLPWKIRLHFTAYPNSEILPLEANLTVDTQVHRFFKNSFKQAVSCLHGSNKVALNVTKESHGRLWRSVQTANFVLYQQTVRGDLPAIAEPVSMVPIRLYMNAKPPIQRPCRDGTLSLGALLAAWLPDHFCQDKDATESIPDVVTFRPTETIDCWKVGGIQPPLDTTVLDLWKTLSHADHFLYIVVQTNYSNNNQ